MKRSAANKILEDAKRFMADFKFTLPPFARWSVEELQQQASAEIKDARLGWDMTDYGRGKFDTLGLLLFTLRNGSAEDLKNGSGMLYAEKLMISRKDQLSPMHRHVIKAEDIINRGGGELIIELFASAPSGDIDRANPVTVPCDGIARTFEPGGKLVLNAGESVTLMPGVWHAFWAEKHDVLIGEVSTVNDDLTDNIFAEPIDRFSTIEEDETPLHLLVSDYDQWLN